MGILTLTNFRDELALALGRPSLNVAPFTRLDLWINGAYREIGYAFKFSELEASASFNTVDGTQSYDLTATASDFRMLHEEGLRKTSPAERIGKLKKETRSQYLRRIGDTANTTNRGSPEWYHRFGKSLIYLRPIPDATVVAILFHYWKKITKLTNPGDMTVLGEDWDDAVLTGAMYRGFRAQGEHDKYLNSKSDFLGQVRSRVLEEDIEEFPQGGLNIQTTAENDDALVSDSD